MIDSSIKVIQQSAPSSPTVQVSAVAALLAPPLTNDQFSLAVLKLPQLTESEWREQIGILELDH